MEPDVDQPSGRLRKARSSRLHQSFGLGARWLLAAPRSCGAQTPPPFTKETEKWSSSRADRRAFASRRVRLTTLLETDQPRFLVQRAGDEPTNPASAINVSLRSLQTDAGVGQLAQLVQGRRSLRRLLGDRLLSARIKNLAGLSQHPELRLDLPLRRRRALTRRTLREHRGDRRPSLRIPPCKRSTRLSSSCAKPCSDVKDETA